MVVAKVRGEVARVVRGGRLSKVGSVVFAMVVFSLPPVATAAAQAEGEDPVPDQGLFADSVPSPDQSATAALSGQALADGFSLTTLWDDLVNPTAVEFAPDGRVYIAEKSGLIKAYDDMSDPTAVVVADLRDNIHNYWDRGLFGLAFDPQFPTDPYIYTLYTYDEGNSWNDTCPTPPGPTDSGCVVDGRLSRLTIDPSTNLQVGSELVLIENKWCSQYPSHSIGDLFFDTTGALIATSGDGASFNFGDYGQGGGTGGIPVNPCNDPDPTQSGGVPSPPDAEGGALRSQDILTSGDPQSYDGTVIRVDPATGAALSDNPLYGGAISDDDAIVAHGLRNPYRATLRPGTTEIWLGDVGWGGFEEINRIVDPTDATVENFGWPCFEGNGHHGTYDGLNLDLCEGLYSGSITSSITYPYYAYAHGPAPDTNGCPSNGAATSGLQFSNSPSYAAEYQGALFFADYSHECIWVMLEGSGGDPDPGQVSTFISDVSVVDLSTAPTGELVATDFDTGDIFLVNGSAPPATCAPETATIEAEAGTLLGSFQTGPDGQASGGAYVHAPNGSGKTFSFDPTRGVTFCFDVATAGSFRIAAGAHAANGGSNSFFVQVDGGPVWLWDLNQDTTYGEQFVRDRSLGEIEVALGSGEHTVGVYLREDGTRIDTIRLDRVGGGGNTPPTAGVDAPSPFLTWEVGEAIAFSGTGTDAEDVTIGPGGMEWNLLLHHCETPTDCHVHVIETRTGVSSGTFVAVDHELPSYLEIELTVTDSGGLTDVDSVDVYPETVDITFESVPSGLVLTAGGENTDTTPFVHTAIVGGDVGVLAPTPQALGSTGYDFDSWSDGGARNHIITAPASPITLTATYVEGAPPTCGGLAQEAEDGTLLGSFTTGADAAASNNAFVHAPQGSGSSSTFSAANGVEFCMAVATSGTYRIETDVLAPDGGSNSFFVQVDGGPVWLWDINTGTGYGNAFVQDRTLGTISLDLTPGDHTVGVYLREDGTRIDTIELVNMGGGGPPTCGGLTQEAEAGTLLGSFVTGSDAAASGGGYAHAPQGSGSSSGSFSTANGVEFCVDVATTATYRLAGNVYAADGGSNSFYVQVDGGPVWLWDIDLNTTYENQEVHDRSPVPATVTLGAGSHTVGVYLREDGARLDTIEVIETGFGTGANAQFGQ